MSAQTCMAFTSEGDEMVETCGAPVTHWRACGCGCGDKFSLAYCPPHGGEKRAAEEMRKHHLSAHADRVC